MRKRQTFLLTILTPDNDTGCFCGKLKVISSGKICTFTDMEELYRLIASEMDEETLERFRQGERIQNGSEDLSGAACDAS